MEETPSSGRQYLTPKNQSDSSSHESKKSARANLVIPSGCYHDQQEVDSGRVVCPVVEEEGTNDSERTVSIGGIPSDGNGDVMEADSGHCKAGDKDSRSEDAEEDEKQTGDLKTYKGKSVDPGHGQQVIFLQQKRGLLKILPEKIMVARGKEESSMLSNNSKMDGETGDGKILLTDTTAVVPLPHAPNRREILPIPQWLKDCKSELADLDGWQHWQVRRYYPIMRKDKFYLHRDYAHTFRSKADVKNFLDTAEAKGKGLLQKISSDPGVQSSGPRRSTKRRMELLAIDPDTKSQGYGSSTRGDMVPSSSKLPHGFV